MVGIDADSDGLQRARDAGVKTTHEGIDGLLPHIAEDNVQMAFDATSAYVHAENARKMAEHCLSAGARGFVDGGLTGGPPRSLTSGTKLFLSGKAALVAEVCTCFEGTFLSAVPVAREEVGAASAVKACFAAWTKGQTALLQNIVSLSVAEGVQQEEEVVDSKAEGEEGEGL